MMLNVYFDNQSRGHELVCLLLPVLLLPLNGSFPVPLNSFRQAIFHFVPFVPLRMAKPLLLPDVPSRVVT